MNKTGDVIQTIDARNKIDILLEIVSDQQDLIMKQFHEEDRSSRERRKVILDLSCRINTKIGLLIINGNMADTDTVRENEPKLGSKGICQSCGNEIIYVGPYWDHVGMKPRHPAVYSKITK